MMFRKKYYNMNEQIFPDQELVNKVIDSISEPNIGINRAKFFFYKPITIAAMLMILTFTATPILAANVPVIYELMYLVSPTIAQFFLPVQKSCENNGIKLEVISTYIHDDTAEIYITMQDLIGNRVDETTDLNDSYSINRPFDSSATCQRIDYNEQTKTVTFLLSITEWGNKNIDGDKITFSVKNFLSDKQTYNEIPILVDLTNIEATLPTRQASTVGSSGTKYKEYSPNYENNAMVLVPSDPIAIPVEGINFTGIGYIDHMLHLQISVVDNLTKDNHGSFFLIDKNGKQIECDYTVHFIENFDSNNRIDYTEFVFNIPQSEIGEYSLYGTFFTSGLFTQGNWQVTFPLETTKKNWCTYVPVTSYLNKEQKNPNDLGSFALIKFIL